MEGEEVLFVVAVFYLILALISGVYVDLVGLDWRHICLAVCLVLQVLAVFKFPCRMNALTGIKIFRPGIADGLYCVLLLPLSVWAENLHFFDNFETGDFHQSEIVFLLTTSSVMLIIIPRVYPSPQHDYTSFRRLTMSSLVLLVSAALIFGNRCWTAWAVGFVILFIGMANIPKLCPRSFTIGEVCVVCHLLAITAWRVTCGAETYFYNPKSLVVNGNDTNLYTFISVMIVFFVLATAVYFYSELRGSLTVFLLIYAVFAIVALLMLQFIMSSSNPLLWLIQFIFTSNARLCLLAWWFVMALFTGVSVCFYSPITLDRSKNRSKMSFSVRKFFHLVVVLVYIPGLIIDPQFLFLASVVALCVLALFEVSRITQVPWLGSAVDKSFRAYTDERDQGPVLLTHIYLLAGLSLPLWLSHGIGKGDLRLFCGVISLGIGDTVACVFGTKYGRTKWPGGNSKTLEGTSAALFSQLVFILWGAYFGWFEVGSWSIIVFAVIISSLFEAMASQIDNLVLPLFMLCFQASTLR